MRIAVVAGVLAVMVLPAMAQDGCFSGEPTKVTYSDGRVVTIIQRHGDDLTFTTPYEGYQDSVTKTHLMLVPKQGRQGARSTEFQWSSKQPKLSQLVPGYKFDLEGTMKSGGGEAVPYRIEGEVRGPEDVMVGDCSYAALAVVMSTFLDNQLIVTATQYLSPDMKVILKSAAVPVSGGQKADFVAVALE